MNHLRPENEKMYPKSGVEGFLALERDVLGSSIDNSTENFDKVKDLGATKSHHISPLEKNEDNLQQVLEENYEQRSNFSCISLFVKI